MIEKHIFMVRGQRVMLSPHLAYLYDVKLKALTQAVKRNKERFPEDFMFQLTPEEANSLRSQIVTLKNRSRSQFVTLKRGQNIKYLPYAFTEPGVAMLSSVLNSRRAIQVNIQIIRTFIKMRELMVAHKDLRIKIDEMEKKYDSQFQVVFKAIKLLIDEKPKKDFDGKRFEAD